MRVAGSVSSAGETVLLPPEAAAAAAAATAGPVAGCADRSDRDADVQSVPGDRHSATVSAVSFLKSDELEDLRPTPNQLRTWGVVNYMLLWASMAVGVGTYMMGGSLLTLGLNWWQGALCAFLGALVVLVPLVLNGHAGVAFAISFPVFLRSSFGMRGAQFAALSRGMVGIGWFSFQAWIGASAVYQALVAMAPAVAQAPWLGAWMGINLAQLLCFLFFLGVHVLLVLVGSIRASALVQRISAPLLTLAGLAFFVWLCVRVGLERVLSATYELPDYREGSFLQGVWPALSAVLGAWSTLSLNILDFTRYCRAQWRQAVGQALGLPPALTLFALLGMIGTASGWVLFGAQLWSPADLFGRFPAVWVRVLACALIVCSTVAVNMAANVISSANDVANIAPERISFKMGGLVTCVLGLLLMPWRLFADPRAFVFTWLIGYSAVLGAVAGVMLCDYFVLRRTRLHVPSLYEHSSRSLYWFSGGVNVCALLAVLLGALPCVPGFLIHAGAVSRDAVSAGWTALYDFAWFVAVAVAGVVHFALMHGLRWLAQRWGWHRVVNAYRVQQPHAELGARQALTAAAALDGDHVAGFVLRSVARDSDADAPDDVSESTEGTYALVRNRSGTGDQLGATGTAARHLATG